MARRLGQALGLPVHHLDALYWKPGWTPTPRAEWRALQTRLVAGERWLIDGNYGGTMELRLAAADTVIFLDLPRWVCLLGALQRWVQFRGRRRPDMAVGCPERINLDFLKWVWRFPVEQRPGILAKLEQLNGSARVVHLRSRREMEAFVAGVESQSNPLELGTGAAGGLH